MSNGSNKDETKEIILDSIADGVFTIDKDWKITSFNRAAEQITSIPREEAIGQRCCDVFRASICESSCALRETFRTGEPVVNKAVFIIDASGRKIPISISAAVLRNKNGEMLGKAPILDTIRQYATSGAAQINDAILDTPDRFIGDAKIEDDITSVVIKI